MSVLDDIRHQYHRDIFSKILAKRADADSLNIADVSSPSSKKLAELMVQKIGLPLCATPPSGQSAGTLFADITRLFLEQSFHHLQHIRPGKWQLTTQGPLGIAGYVQYAHLAELQKMLSEYRSLAVSFAGDYLVKPDIVVFREALEDTELNMSEELVGIYTTQTPLRKTNQLTPMPLIHASVSCKWTTRSDRAQNVRTEALNIIRNRKGHAPHIVVVTMEPLPSRLSSIAQGTGDIDCAYHAALPELQWAAAESGLDGQEEILNDLIDGQRLRDISDLPLDLMA